LEQKTQTTKKFQLENGIFWPPAIVTIVLLVIGIVNSDAFSSGASAALSWCIDYFGWLYLLFGFIFFAFVLVVMVCPIGKLKLGGPDAEPEMNYWNWFAIALCAGIAIGILFWGVAEPLYHYSGPPVWMGLEANSPESAIAALEISYFHWTIHPYALYAIFGLAVAYATFNQNLPFRISSGLYPILGKRVFGPIGQAIDGLAVFAIVGGVVTSLGLGTLQLGAGLKFLTGMEPNNFIYVVIIAIITVGYTMSSYTGLHRGIKFLSDTNAKVFFFLLIFLFVVGPTKQILEMGVQAMGGYIMKVVPMSFWADPFDTGGGWAGGWTIFYWAWWIAFAPMVGMFLARISYGRTVRQFLLVNVLTPAFFGMLWFNVFGGTAIYLQHTGVADLLKTLGETGTEGALFALFAEFPLAFITMPLAFFTVAVSFTTLADSMTSTLALMTTKGSHMTGEAPGPVKLFWGLVMGGVTILFLLISGVDSTKALQTSSIVSALPIFLIEMATLVALLFVFYDKGYKSDIEFSETEYFKHSRDKARVSQKSSDVSA